MRHTCTFCARKHLSQAYILCEEVAQGYPEHVWLAIGHMAEASAELLQKHPIIANDIREARKTLEESLAKHPGSSVEWKFPDFMAMLKRISDIPEAAPGRIPIVTPPTTAPNRTTAPTPAPDRQRDLREKIEAAKARQAATPPPAGGCSTCMDKVKVGRWAAERDQLGPNGKYTRGRLLILTSLGDFSPSYSLTAVILDQAVAAAAAGYRVTIGVHVGCNLADLPELPESIDVVGIIPRLPWKENEVNDEHVNIIKEAIAKVLIALGPCKVIEHDLLFQSWFCTVAKAIHELPQMNDVSWYHLCHSSVGVKNQDIVAGPTAYRRVVPLGHKLVILNYSDTEHFRNYYGYGTVTEHSKLPASQITTLLNPRDCRSFQNMSADAVALISKHIPHLVDVAQVFPLSLTRIAHKHPNKVIELFAEFKKLGQSVRLIIATAHANNPIHQKDAVLFKEIAKAKGLTEEEVVFSHESLPETAVQGLSRNTIRSLFSVTNLFAFPSESEAGSLVLMEAAQTGNLLVLNESLPCLRDYIPPEAAVWTPWGSIKESGKSVPIRPLAEAILTRLEDMGMKSRRHMLRLSSLEAYAERLIEVLGG